MEKQEELGFDLKLFIMVGPDKEVCVGQPLEKEEATKLAVKARKTRHNKICYTFKYCKGC